MATQLPPFPANSPPGGFVWTDWWKKFQDYVEEITEVAGEGTVVSTPITGLTGVSNMDFYWTVVANFLIWQITFDIESEPVVSATNASIGLPADALPRPVRDATCELAAWENNGGAPNVYSIGIGVVESAFIYLPDFTLPGTPADPPQNVYEKLIITGRYFVS